MVRAPKLFLLATILVSTASVADAAERVRLNLPGGRLRDALVALGNQAGVSIGISDPSLADQRVPPVSGNLTVEQALGRLLQGRAGRYVVIDPSTYRIVPGPARPQPRARQVPPVARRAPTPPPKVFVEPELIGNPDIVVIGSRREVPLRSYPGSVTLISGDDPELRDSLRGTAAIVSRVPSLSSTHLGPGRNKLFIRGLSESSFNGPTQATVGQYLGETRLTYNAPDPDLRLFDVERVEVLAGPQGTLYGAGSLGGIIRMVPNAPSVALDEANFTSGVSWTEHGSEGVDMAGVVNAPFSAATAVRVSGYFASEGGYIDDIQRGLEDVNRVRVAGGRLALRTMPDESWTADLSATAQRIRGRDAQFAERETPRLTRRSPIRQNFGNDYFLANATATREWDDLRFVASTGLVRQKFEERFDATREGNPPAAYDLTTRVALFTAEARLSRRLGEGTGWLVGASFISNRLDQSREVDLFTQPVYLRNAVENDIDEGSIYGEAAVRLLPGVVGTLGGRVSASKLFSSGFAFLPGAPLPPAPEEASRTNTSFVPAAALSVRASRNLLFYGRYQESFRPGGLGLGGDEFRRFRSDKIKALEAGLRFGSPGRGALEAAAAVAYTRWSDIQADTINVFAEPATANVGDAKIYTLDLSLTWRPFAGLALEAGAVLNDSAIDLLRREFTGPPGGILSDVITPPLPGVADVNGRLAAHYAFAASDELNLRISAAARYTGKSNLGAGEFLRRAQGDWLDLGLTIAAEIGRHRVTLTGTNLLDTDANRFSFGSPFTLDQREFTTPVRPRTIRLGWEIGF